MTNKEIVLQALENQGKSEALDLRKRSPKMNGTQLIDEEQKIPSFDPKKDYSSWKVGNPVSDEGQVWTLLQPHNASNYEGRPSTLRALWGLAHTKNPAKAKPWVDADGISGAYMKDECYRDNNGDVFKSLNDNQVHDASSYPEGWTKVEDTTSIQ